MPALTTPHPLAPIISFALVRINLLGVAVKTSYHFEVSLRPMTETLPLAVSVSPRAQGRRSTPSTDIGRLRQDLEVLVEALAMQATQ